MNVKKQPKYERQLKKGVLELDAVPLREEEKYGEQLPANCGPEAADVCHERGDCVSDFVPPGG